MKIKVFTLFPEMLRPTLRSSILGRAVAAGLIDVQLIDIRDYTLDRHRSTDDYPFGGGAGMVMTAQPIVDAFAAHCPSPYPGRRVYLSPRGRTLTQRVVEELAGTGELALLCGHYEGVDQRALDSVIDEELSIGDYVLTGGELGALVVIDAVSRLIPGVLGSDESSADESFSTGLLEYPQYTRPASFRGMDVPRVLLDGNHAEIAAWRREQSLALTLERRPALLDDAPLTGEDLHALARLRRAREVSSLLDALRISHRRRSLRDADGWPKRWFAAFVPEDQRKAAKKHCFSGRRHTGALWQAFRMGFAAASEGPEAARRWAEAAPLAEAASPAEAAPPAVELYLPEDGLLFTLEASPALTPGALSSLGGFMLADAAMTATYVSTGVEGVGPYCLT